MKKTIIAFVVAIAAVTATAAPRRVALVVQNHCSGKVELPMAAFADTLAARLSGKDIHIVNPANRIGTTQNSTAQGEVMPDMSVAELGRILGVDGVLTASVQEFTSEAIGVPPVATMVKARIALALVDCATGDTVCGVGGQQYSRNYTVEQIQQDKTALYEGHFHAAAEKCAERFLAAFANAQWEPKAADTVTVFFGCNVFGADVQIDGLSYGRCPAEVVVSKGVHTIHVSYPPYYLDFKRRALFHTDKQTYVVALQITPEGEKQRRSGELFEKQKALIDAELSRYKKAGDVEDYVKKVIADGTAVYWKNSCSRIIITDGVADSIDFATPKVDGGVLQKGASSAEIGMKLRELLEAK